jgi:hypothetical protein
MLSSAFASKRALWPKPHTMKKALAERSDLPGKQVAGQGGTKGLVIDQRENGAQGIGPANHRHVDDHNHPAALLLTEGIRYFAKADGGGGVAHHIESVKDAHPAWLPVCQHPRHQRQADHRHGVTQDQRNQGKPQAAQDKKQNVVHALPMRDAVSRVSARSAPLSEGFANQKSHGYQVCHQRATRQ